MCDSDFNTTTTVPLGNGLEKKKCLLGDGLEKKKCFLGDGLEKKKVSA